MKPQLSIAFGQYSGAGAKPENQDFHGALVPDDGTLATKGIAIAIADGISTSEVGAQAAETAVKSFLTDYFATSEAWSVRTSGERVISATNSWMFANNDRVRPRVEGVSREAIGLICTLSALVFKSRAAHIFHIGDAQIALVRAGRLLALTDPHQVHIGGGRSYLARALGTGARVDIDYRQLVVQQGDVFVLTTDGIHEYLDDERIAGIASDPDSSADARAEAMAQAAAAAGSPDNLTVVLAQVESLPDGEIEDLIGSEAILPPAPMLRSGEEFEGYAILRPLHSGSRSHVYLARDVHTDTRVALKVPSTEHSTDERQMHALLLEEWVARRVDNPHVLKAAPQNRARGHAYSVTEYVEGQPLDEWMADASREDLASVRSIIKQIASGLHALHRKEMVHRDLRPRNVLIDAEGTARIIDFGSTQVAGLDELAPHPEDGMFAGTMQYSAPELYRGEPATHRSDLYSLGVIAYQMLTGKLPYGPRVSAADTRAAQRKLHYVPITETNPAVPDWMDAAIACAVAIDPARRYSELSEFTYDLAHPNPTLTAPDPRPWMARKPERVWQVISTMLAIALAISLWPGG